MHPPCPTRLQVREQRALAACEHPFLPRLLASYQDEAQLFLLMEVAAILGRLEQRLRY